MNTRVRRNLVIVTLIAVNWTLLMVLIWPKPATAEPEWLASWKDLRVGQSINLILRTDPRIRTVYTHRSDYRDFELMWAPGALIAFEKPHHVEISGDDKLYISDGPLAVSGWILLPTPDPSVNRDTERGGLDR